MATADSGAIYMYIYIKRFTVQNMF